MQGNKLLTEGDTSAKAWKAAKVKIEDKFGFELKYRKGLPTKHFFKYA